MTNWIHPAAILIIGSLAIPFLPKTAKKVYMLALTAAAFWATTQMTTGVYWTYEFIGNELIFGRADKLSIVFSYMFTIMGFLGVLFALRVDDNRQHVAGLLYAGSSLGVVFAGDLFTLFIFWKIMAFASAYLVFAGKTKESIKAGMRYLMVHVFGGVCLLAGIVIHFSQTGSLAFEHFGTGGGAGFYLILIGFILNAAAPPLSAWLPDAYPRATITGSIFLCAFTTKTAIYVLIRGYAGTELLIYLGVFMALFGVGYAVIENNIRRLLSYHIISQVGYMVAAVGIGTHLAINGATAFAFTNILYKALLFMGAGSIIHMTGKNRLSNMGGLYKAMPFTFIFYMIGGFAISGVPLFSGFVTKSLIISAAGEQHMKYVWLLLMLAAIGTFLSTTLKLPYLAFMNKDKADEKLVASATDPPPNMLYAMAITAGLCILIGVYPRLLYNLLPYETNYQPYSMPHIVWSGQLILLTWLGYYWYIKKLYAKPALNLDTDWFYRNAGQYFMNFINGPFSSFGDELGHFVFKSIPGFFIWISKNPLAIIRIATDKTISEMSSSTRKREINTRMVKEKMIYPGDIIKRWPIGSTVLWVTLFLLTCLLVYYI